MHPCSRFDENPSCIFQDIVLTMLATHEHTHARTHRTETLPRYYHRHRRWGQGGNVPPKIREKYFSGNYYVKFGHFADF